MDLMRNAILILCLGILMACASAAKDRTQDTEQLLSAAGFMPRPADTEAKMAHLASLPQHTVIPQDHAGKMFYIYADETVCNCLFVGNAAAYQKYSQYAVQNRIANEQQEAADMSEDAAMDASMNWELWGGLYPWD